MPSPTRVKLDEFELSPEDWKAYPPRYGDDRPEYYRVEFLLDEEDVAAFIDLHHWFQMAIDDAEPIKARFGRLVWQREDESSKRRVLGFLIPEPKGGEEDDDPGGGEPVRTNSITEGLWTKAGLEALIDELTQSGTLTTGAADSIRARADEASKGSWFRLHEDDNIAPYRGRDDE